MKPSNPVAYLARADNYDRKNKPLSEFFHTK